MKTIEQLVGENMKAARERADLSQEELGQRLKPLLGKAWSRHAVSIAEGGGRSFVVAELAALALVLETSILRLLGPSEDERVKFPGKGIARAQMFDVLFGPAGAGLEDDFTAHDRSAAGRAQLKSVSEDLRVCLEEAQDGLASLKTFTKNFDKLVSAGWGIVR